MSHTALFMLCHNLFFTCLLFIYTRYLHSYWEENVPKFNVLNYGSHHFPFLIMVYFLTVGFVISSISSILSVHPHKRFLKNKQKLEENLIEMSLRKMYC